jgi:hypothetical protein
MFEEILTLIIFVDLPHKSPTIFLRCCLPSVVMQENSVRTVLQGEFVLPVLYDPRGVPACSSLVAMKMVAYVQDYPEEKFWVLGSEMPSSEEVARARQGSRTAFEAARKELCLVSE